MAEYTFKFKPRDVRRWLKEADEQSLSVLMEVGAEVMLQMRKQKENSNA